MNNNRIGGLLLLAVGIVLLVVGFRASDSIADRFSNFFSGHFTESTVWYMLGGALLTVVGLSLATRGNVATT